MTILEIISELDRLASELLALYEEESTFEKRKALLMARRLVQDALSYANNVAS